jgi:ribosomal protein S27AE
MFNALQEQKMDRALVKLLNTNVQTAVALARHEAAHATAQFLAQHGERDACGFAWVTVHEKGSTKLGRELLKNGFSKAYGGGLQLWNPSGSYTQAITAKEVGAEAAARVLRERLGVEAYAGSRLD